jgi:hypothetical protein
MTDENFRRKWFKTGKLSGAGAAMQYQNGTIEGGCGGDATKTARQACATVTAQREMPASSRREFR